MSQHWFPATVHADDGAPVPGMKLNVTFGEFSWVVETDAEGDAAFLAVAPSRSRCTVFNVLAPTYTVWVDIDVYSLYVDYDSGLALVATPFMVTVSSTVRSDDALQLATTESSCSITPVNPFMDVFGYTYFSVLCTSVGTFPFTAQRNGSSLSTSPVSLYVYSMSFYYYPKLAYTNHEFTIYVMINNVHQPRSLVMYLGTKERSCTVLTMTSGFGAGTGTFSVMCTSAGDFVFEASIDPTFETKYEGVVSVTGSGVKELLSNTHVSL